MNKKYGKKMKMKGRREEEREIVVELGMNHSGEVAQLVLGEVEVARLGLEQGPVLPDQAVFRFGQYAFEIVPAQGAQLDPDRQPALKLGQKVRRLGLMKGTRGDE